MMLFSQDEDDALRNPVSKIDTRVNDLFVHGYGRFPDSRIFEETIDGWRSG